MSLCRHHKTSADVNIIELYVREGLVFLNVGTIQMLEGFGKMASLSLVSFEISLVFPQCTGSCMLEALIKEEKRILIRLLA